MGAGLIRVLNECRGEADADSVHAARYLELEFVERGHLEGRDPRDVSRLVGGRRGSLAGCSQPCTIGIVICVIMDQICLGVPPPSGWRRARTGAWDQCPEAHDGRTVSQPAMPVPGRRLVELQQRPQCAARTRSTRRQMRNGLVALSRRDSGPELLSSRATGAAGRLHLTISRAPRRHGVHLQRSRAARRAQNSQQKARDRGCTSARLSTAARDLDIRAPVTEHSAAEACCLPS